MKLLFFLCLLASVNATEFNDGSLILKTKDQKNYKLVPNGQYESKLVKTYKSDDSHLIKISSKLYSANQFGEVKKDIKNKMIQLRALYGDQISPYAGQLTQQVNCFDMKQFKKDILESSKQLKIELQLLSNKQLSYGSCGADLLHSKLVLLFCKNDSTLYEVKFFSSDKTAYQAEVQCKY